MTEPVNQAAEKDLPFCIQNSPQELLRADVQILRPGMLCPQCGHAALAYDGLLNLSCPSCGYSGGGGSCT